MLLRRLAQPAEQVLDAGVWAGYGSAELARAAAGVLGIDRSAEAIAFAREQYPAPNLRFEEGDCLSLPAPEGSIDLVVAFEVIEHLEDWRGFLLEARRVLAPAGQFIVSTPNKLYYSESRRDAGPNPFHVHEFEFDEFRAELSAVFPHVSLFLENHAECVVFQPAASPDAEMTAGIRVDDAQCSPEESHFFVAVCASRPQTGAPTFVYVPRVANVLRERERHIELLEGELETKNQWLNRSIADLAKLNEDHQDVPRPCPPDADRRICSAPAGRNSWDRSWKSAARALCNYRRSSPPSRLPGARWPKRTKRSCWSWNRRTRPRPAGRSKPKPVSERNWTRNARNWRSASRFCMRLNEPSRARTAWAGKLQTEAYQLERQVNLMKESRWFKVGRKLGMGPEMRNS